MTHPYSIRHTDETEVALTENEFDLIRSALYGETEVHYANKTKAQMDELYALQRKLNMLL